MNSHNFYEFITRHNVEIIQWLIVAIVIVSLLYLALQLFSSSSGEKSSNNQQPTRGDSPEALNQREVVDKVNSIMAEQTGELQSGSESASVDSVDTKAASPAGASGGQASGPVPETLQKELKEKDQEIASLRAEVEKAKTDGTSSAELQKKIEELESKLAEYEILEDDIADLSLFKEENARLKQELDALKGAGGASATGEEAEASVNEEVVEEKTPEENFVAEFEEAVSGAATVAPNEPSLEEAGTTETAADAPAVEEDSKENYVEEFEAAVQKEKEASASGNEIETSAEEQPVAEKNEPASDNGDEEEASSSESADDILAEFAQSLEEDQEEGEQGTTASSTEKKTLESKESPAIDTSLDTDKMLAEMADLANVKEEEGSALEEELDTEKMAAEASKLISND